MWTRHGKPTFRHYHAMMYMLPRLIGLLHEHDEETMFKPEFFQQRRSKAVGWDFVQVAPVAQWADEAVKLGFNVGTRGNGHDRPYWPEDLGTEVVA